MTYNENNRNTKPISRYISPNEVEIKSSFDKYLEKVEKATGETKFIYFVTNDESAVGKQKILHNEDYFKKSI